VPGSTTQVLWVTPFLVCKDHKWHIMFVTYNIIWYHLISHNIILDAIYHYIDIYIYHHISSYIITYHHISSYINVYVYIYMISSIIYQLSYMKTNISYYTCHIISQHITSHHIYIFCNHLTASFNLGAPQISLATTRDLTSMARIGKANQPPNHSNLSQNEMKKATPRKTIYIYV
jgi:hypothetical protein